MRGGYDLTELTTRRARLVGQKLVVRNLLILFDLKLYFKAYQGLERLSQQGFNYNPNRNWMKLSPINICHEPHNFIIQSICTLNNISLVQYYLGVELDYLKQIFNKEDSRIGRQSLEIEDCDPSDRRISIHRFDFLFFIFYFCNFDMLNYLWRIIYLIMS